jgi:hypothetical protein
MTSRDSTPNERPSARELAAESSAVLPFDRVVVHEPQGTRTLSAEAFFSLPLSQRIQFVVERKVSFLAGSESVDPKTALAQIRRSRARPS